MIKGIAKSKELPTLRLCIVDYSLVFNLYTFRDLSHKIRELVFSKFHFFEKDLLYSRF